MLLHGMCAQYSSLILLHGLVYFVLIQRLWAVCWGVYVSVATLKLPPVNPRGMWRMDTIAPICSPTLTHANSFRQVPGHDQVALRLFIYFYRLSNLSICNFLTSSENRLVSRIKNWLILIINKNTYIVI